jgi:hypothetical protein
MNPHTNVSGLPVPPAAAWHAVDACTRSAARPRRARRTYRSLWTGCLLAGSALLWFGSRMA